MADPLEPGTALNEEAGWASYEPVIRLTQVVQTKTYEEDEDEFHSIERAKLFLFHPKANEWKERGMGKARLLQHKKTKKIRLVMRRDATHKVCANHLVFGELTRNVGSDRSWIWICHDYSEDSDPHIPVTFALRFSMSEIANAFKMKWDEARKINGDGTLRDEGQQGQSKGKEEEEEEVAANTKETVADAKEAVNNPKADGESEPNAQEIRKEEGKNTSQEQE